MEVVYEALGRALAAAKRAGLVPEVPGIPHGPRKEIVLAMEYVATHPGITEWLAGAVPEKEPQPIASRVTK